MSQTPTDRLTETISAIHDSPNRSALAITGVLAGHDEIYAVGPISDLVFDPGQVDFQLFVAEGHRAAAGAAVAASARSERKAFVKASSLLSRERVQPTASSVAATSAYGTGEPADQCAR